MIKNSINLVMIRSRDYKDRLRILVDQDEVLAKWVERVIDWWNNDKGTNLTVDDIHSWDLKNDLGEGSEDFMRSCMRYSEFYRDLDPMPGAIDGMRSLIDMGHDVLIVTATPRCATNAYGGKVEWIRRNMPFFNIDNFCSVTRKDVVSGDILLDDGMHNIEAFHRTKRDTCVFTRPWNKNAKAPTFRANSWSDFVELIKTLSDGASLFRFYD